MDNWARNSHRPHSLQQDEHQMGGEPTQTAFPCEHLSHLKAPATRRAGCAVQPLPGRWGSA